MKPKLGAGGPAGGAAVCVLFSLASACAGEQRRAHAPDGARSERAPAAEDARTGRPPLPPTPERWFKRAHEMPSIALAPMPADPEEAFDASADELRGVADLYGPDDLEDADDADAIEAVEVTSTQQGRATWYGGRFHGRLTASGERFDKRALTAAHRRLPFGSYVRVTNLRNDRSIVVRINDRGPFGDPRRIIDVSRRGAEDLGMVDSGVVPVKLEILAAAPGDNAPGDNAPGDNEPGAASNGARE